MPLVPEYQSGREVLRERELLRSPTGKWLTFAGFVLSLLSIGLLVSGGASGSVETWCIVAITAFGFDTASSWTKFRCRDRTGLLFVALSWLALRLAVTAVFSVRLY